MQRKITHPEFRELLNLNLLSQTNNRKKENKTRISSQINEAKLTTT